MVLTHELPVIVGFLILIFILIALDLGVFNKGSHVVSFKEAAVWSVVWVLFSFVIYFVIIFKGDFIHGIETPERLTHITQKFYHPIVLTGNFEHDLALYNHNLGLEFLTGYLIEKSLSVDNIFVIILILMSFKVDKAHFKKILLWGIIGAVVLRFIFIFLSSALIQNFHWVLYIFGVILIFSGIKIFIQRKEEEKVEVENHPMVRFATRYFRTHPNFVGDKFFVRIDGKKFITPLFIVLLVVEFSDLIFAVDSVPAVFSVTQDPVIVFLSNICAIMGLRSLFFLVYNAMQKIHYLKIGLAILLSFIGLKMIIADYLKEIGFRTIHSLLIILGILTITFLLSFLFPPKEKKQ